jgi:hypothetical protein
MLRDSEIPSVAADEAVGIPITINAAGSTPGNGFSARASTKSWRDNASKDLSKRIDSAKAATPKDLKIPAGPHQLEPPAEFWSTLEVQGISNGGGANDQSVRGGVGANYQVSPSTTFGVSAERGATKAAAGSSAGEDEKLSAFMTFKAAPILSIDARTQWQANRPSAAQGATNERSEKGSIIVAPRVSHTFAMAKGQTIEPFVNYKRELEIAAAGSSANEENSAGAGVTVALPESYSISATTDIEGLDRGPDKNVKGKVQIKLPLN